VARNGAKWRELPAKWHELAAKWREVDAKLAKWHELAAKWLRRLLLENTCGSSQRAAETTPGREPGGSSAKLRRRCGDDSWERAWRRNFGQFARKFGKVIDTFCKEHICPRK
jgi:hypothetical protein